MRRLLFAVFACLTIFVPPAPADEGMWLFQAPPNHRLRETYEFEPALAWLEHVQKSAIRFNSGGSGSFVSAEGLIITNHHVAADELQKLSTKEKNFLATGFHARTRAEELRCKNLELNVLYSVEDVTHRVNAAVPAGADAAAAFAARRAAKAAIEAESLTKTGLRSDVVTLYQGAEYHLYRYKQYTDVRMVFAPEAQAAFFGGDPDNFEFPRFNLDFTLLRAYEGGKPAKIEHYLKVQPRGVEDGELVFVAGNPGRTSRLRTVPEMEFERDVHLPNLISVIKAGEVALGSWSARGAENARRAANAFFGLQNSRKVLDGHLAALLDEGYWTGKRAQEKELRDFAATRPELAEAVSAWGEIAEARRTIGEHYLRKFYLEGALEHNADTAIARTLYRSAAEKVKPSGERLREFRDSNLSSLELDLFSEEPIYDDFEQVQIAVQFTNLATHLGAEDPAVKAVLAGRNPAERAAELVLGTQVRDIAFRRKVYAMSAAEVEALDDPMIAMVRAIDAEARAERKIVEEQEEAIEQAQAKIAKVRYAKYGATVYPDATFTLRLAFGAVKGYRERGREVAPFTTLGGKFERSTEHGNREPFSLPESWVQAKGRLRLETQYNFVHTCDIIGGNSGSPTLNRAGEFVGIIFDGNIQSLAADYAYSEEQSRALSVDVRAILEALRNIYGAEPLAAELLGSGRGALTLTDTSPRVRPGFCFA